MKLVKHQFEENDYVSVVAVSTTKLETRMLQGLK